MILNNESILSLYRNLGDHVYSGEPVTQLEHSWQCAQLASSAGASDSLKLAAWLHDLGHLLVDHEGTPTLRGVDDRHEEVAAHLLEPYFGLAVSEPIRLHVKAKRYLVTRNPEYFSKLSEDSVRSLKLQGGLMSDSEFKVFSNTPFSNDALQLRTWDDIGKKQGFFAVTREEALKQLHLLMQTVLIAKRQLT
jgi:[1-hydroxy-2-(trimethylamino)ethyl]phosphonate dioxygenase